MKTRNLEVVLNAKIGHIARDCRMHNNKDQSGQETAMPTMPDALMSFTDCSKCEYWVIHSACTRHMSCHRRSFENFSLCEGTVPVGNNETIRSCRTGIVRIVTAFSGKKLNVTLYYVFDVRNIMYNLITVSGVRQNNCRIVVDNAVRDSRPELRPYIKRTCIQLRWWHLRGTGVSIELP